MCVRIELKMTGNGNKATASVRLHLLLCSWLCGCVSVRCQSHLSQNGFTETLKCSGGVTRQKPPNPPERSARAVMKEKQGCRWENTTVHQKVSRNHLAPKDLRWHNGRYAFSAKVLLQLICPVTPLSVIEVEGQSWQLRLLRPDRLGPPSDIRPQ